MKPTLGVVDPRSCVSEKFNRCANRTWLDITSTINRMVDSTR